MGETKKPLPGRLTQQAELQQAFLSDKTSKSSNEESGNVKSVSVLQDRHSKFKGISVSGFDRAAIIEEQNESDIEASPVTRPKSTNAFKAETLNLYATQNSTLQGDFPGRFITEESSKTYQSNDGNQGIGNNNEEFKDHDV